MRERRRARRRGSRLIAPALLVIACTAPGSAAQPAHRPLCAIDMGSNTFRRLVGSFENGRYLQTSIEQKTMGVGDDLARHGRISDAKLAEIERTLAAFKRACDKEGAAPAVAIGTAAFREAPNGVRVVEIAAELGIRMEIATGPRESEMAYLVGTLGRDGYAVIDNGSRSIELVARSNGTPSFVVFNLGYRVAYEKFFAAAEHPEIAVRQFADELRRAAANASFMTGKKALIGVEFADMAEILFEPAEIEGRVLPLTVLKRRLAEISAGGADAFRSLKQKPGIDRALPRLVVAATLTEEFGYSQLELTARELGTALIIEAGLQRR
jgi:exopolyphosphatase/pppGpp-phosphohydrolase